MNQEQLLNDGKAIIRGKWLGSKTQDTKGEKKDEKGTTRAWHIQGITHSIFCGKESINVEERPPRGTEIKPEDLEKHANRFKQMDTVLIELNSLRRGDLKEGGTLIAQASWNGIHAPTQASGGRVQA